MATRVFYNGVQMYNVLTRKWDQEIVYDDSGTDPISNRFSLEFEGIIHTQSLAQPGQDNAPTTFVGTPDAPVSAAVGATAIYQVVAARLSEARKSLQVLFDTDLALNVVPSTSSFTKDMDVANGPKPRSVNLVRIVGRHAFCVRFAIDCEVLLCRTTPYQSGNLEGLALSNRWRISESLDGNFFTTRIIEGTLKVARTRTLPSATIGDPGHLFKLLVVPPLEEGFRRDRIDFAVEPDNLTCTYNVTDKQVHHSAPYPATKIDVTHSESTADGNTYYATVNVKLEGPPHADKAEMLARMIEIADRKIGITDIKNTLIENLEIIDHIGEFNVVEANFRVRHIRDDSREAITKLQVKTWGKPLAFDTIPVITEDDDPDDRKGTIYNPRHSLVPYIYGYGTQSGLRNTAFLFLLHCYLQDPCKPPHDIYQVNQQPDPATLPANPRDETTINEKSPGELQSEPLDSLSTETTQVGMYTFSAIRNRYVAQRMRTQMPIAKILGINNGPTAVLFDLAEPQMYRVIEVEMERLGSPPRLPFPVESYRFGQSNQGLAVLKENTVSPRAPVLSPDSSQLIYRASGTYWYMMDRPLAIVDSMDIGRNPLISPEFAPNAKPIRDYFTQ